MSSLNLLLPAVHWLTHCPDTNELFYAYNGDGHAYKHLPSVWANVPTEQFDTHFFVT